MISLVRALYILAFAMAIVVQIAIAVSSPADAGHRDALYISIPGRPLYLYIGTPSLQSKLVSELNRLCNIVHRMTTSYHPQTNGLTERFNKTLAEMLSMYVDVEHKNWDEILPFVTFAYNTSRQETTGFSPFYLMHGREAETTLDTMFPYSCDEVESNYLNRLITQTEESRQLSRIRSMESQEKERLRYDSKRRMVKYNPGDLVWIFTPVRKVGLSEKLLKRYFGPYQVLRQLSDVTYEVQDFDPTSRRKKPIDKVHVVRMKPYHDPDEQADILQDDLLETNDKASNNIEQQDNLSDDPPETDQEAEGIPKVAIDFQGAHPTVNRNAPIDHKSSKEKQKNFESYAGPVTRSRSRKENSGSLFLKDGAMTRRDIGATDTAGKAPEKATDTAGKAAEKATGIADDAVKAGTGILSGVLP